MAAKAGNKNPWTAYREGERDYFASIHQRNATIQRWSAAGERARRENALNANVCHDGEVITRRALVDRCVAEGRRVITVQSGERRLIHDDGRYLNEDAIGKFAMDYAVGQAKQ